MTNVLLWAVSAPFDYGTLNVSLSSKIDLINLKRIIEYSKAKGSAGYPSLNYILWRHIACTRIGIPEKLAWLYFDTFSLLMEISAERRYNLEMQVLKVKKTGDEERFKDSRKVDCLKFMVLLYIQQFNVIGRVSSVIINEDWPSSWKSADSKEHRRQPSSEASHHAFLKTHLEELLTLLSTDNRRDLSDDSMTLQCVAALGLIVEGSLDGGKTIVPIEDILTHPDIRTVCGFSEATRTYQIKPLSAFIKSQLKLNPYIGENCIRHGVILNRSWHSNGSSSVGKRRGVLVSNFAFAPENRKLVIIANLVRATAIEGTLHYEDSEVKIHRSSSSYIYILCPMKSVTISKCKNTTIVLSAVQTTVIVDQCENIRVSVACRRFVISNTKDSICYLLTSHAPIMLSGNQHIQFAPFNTNYPMLDRIIMKAGLVFGMNYWNKPTMPSLTNCSSVLNSDTENSSVWSFLPADGFHLINVPITNPAVIVSRLPEAVYPLPKEYQAEIDRRNGVIEEWKVLTKNAALSGDQKKAFQNFVEGQFQLWLKASGGKREIDQLLHLTTSTNGGASNSL